jgi:hypothetical protein
MNIVVFFYTYLFPCKIGTNVGVNILGNKKLLAFIENPISSFLEDEKLYENEVCLEATFEIIKLVFVDGIVYFNIFNRKNFTPTYLISAITRWMTFYFLTYSFFIG